MANTTIHISLGTRFGQLTTISEPYREAVSSGKNRTMVRVRCDCGTELAVRSTSLQQGTTKGCGCLRGKARHSEFRAAHPEYVTTCARKMCGKKLATLAYTAKRTDSKVYGDWFCDHECATAEANVRKQQGRRESGLDTDSTKNRRLTQQYGVSLAEWQAQLARQVNACGICCADLGPYPRDKHTDHSHVTGKVRGILCSRCNTALGLFGDNKDLLVAASEYLSSEGIWDRG